jgi:endonuclease/exonuclease/phosphatase (EEP) superfamily protein YafD
MASAPLMNRRLVRLPLRLKRIISVLALSYPFALLSSVLLLRYVGEAHWTTNVGLYLPRVGFAIPLPLCVSWLAIWGPRKWLWSQVAAVLVLLFPLMGLTVSWPSSSATAKLRVLSYNVNGPHAGFDVAARAIASYSPDIVFAQEAILGPSDLAKALGPRYPFSHSAAGELLVASRFPIVEKTEFDPVPGVDRPHSPRFARYLIETPLGRVAFYNIHPRSPRWVFHGMRGKGLKREILSGRIFSGSSASELSYNSGLRDDQARAIALHASREKQPVVIAGDTNLPGLSPVFARHFSAYRDGFSDAGFGLGYTFPARWPWMRIDRILASDALDFTSFDVGCTQEVSDHLCVVADLRRTRQ